MKRDLDPIRQARSSFTADEPVSRLHAHNVGTSHEATVRQSKWLDYDTINARSHYLPGDFQQCLLLCLIIRGETWVISIIT